MMNRLLSDLVNHLRLSIHLVDDLTAKGSLTCVHHRSHGLVVELLLLLWLVLGALLSYALGHLDRGLLLRRN
jgi:hypothetical protein